MLAAEGIGTVPAQSLAPMPPKPHSRPLHDYMKAEAQE